MGQKARPGVAGSFAGVSQAEVKMLKLWVEPSSKLSLVVSRTHFFVVVGLRLLFPCWSLAQRSLLAPRGYSPVLAHGPLRLHRNKGAASPSLASVQFSSVAQSCLTLCDPMNHSTPGLPVHHQLSGFTQTHVHQVSDAIQPSHPLSSPSPPAPNPSQHQSLFQWVRSLQIPFLPAGEKTLCS